ncbi:MAG: elongation factor G [Candidatus Shikimatogenerans sp. AspAUS03]|uniref:Elongation factor G n=1 Tax=Candidatus Shikimatogenerans sp. AspAUS03 TaxID=3158563 RepID=A0AAU7QS36_9FLAO
MKNIIKYTRNIGIVAHIDAGKTTTTERILFYTGINYKIGEVHDGQATMDWMEQEQKRGITITSAATQCFWNFNKNKYKINIIDTPGHVDFTVEVERSLRILDGLIILFSAVEGVESQSENIWKQADKYNIPRVCFINKMDRPAANYDKVCKEIKKKFLINIVKLHIPIYDKNHNFKYIIDIIENKMYFWKSINYGIEYDIKKIPDNYVTIVKNNKKKIIENLLNLDDEIMTKFCNKKIISNKDIYNSINKLTINNKIVPILCGSSFKNKGIQLLLDSICKYLPSPFLNQNLHFSALVFKICNDFFINKSIFFRVYSGKLKVGDYIINYRTKEKYKISRLYQMYANKSKSIKIVNTGDIAVITGIDNIKTGDTLCNVNHLIKLEKIKFPKPVMGIFIMCKNQSDNNKLVIILNKLLNEDPTLKIKINKNNQTILYGMGELHLEIIIEKIKSNFKLNIITGKPLVDYKENLFKSVIYREIYKKQTGGRGKFAEILFKIGPSKNKEGLEFINKVKGGNIPKVFIASIKKGFKEAMKVGPLFGYELLNMKIILLDGSFHIVDSDNLAFEIAAKLGYKEAVKLTQPFVLEPIMNLQIHTPVKYMGNIISDINKRRGIINNIITKKNIKIIESHVPLSELFGYITKLRTLSSGRAIQYMEFKKYMKISLFIYNKINKSNE